jgi:hypothetical protein
VPRSWQGLTRPSDPALARSAEQLTYCLATPLPLCTGSLARRIALRYAPNAIATDSHLFFFCHCQ